MVQALETVAETVAKIRDIEQLPTFEEAKQLILLLEEGHRRNYRYTSWQKFCEKHGIWSVYTVEFVDALEEVIRGLNETPIVEVCAGNGKLSYHLRKRGIDITATDDYSDEEIKRDERLVERLPHKEVLVKHESRIVIAAFVPPDKGIAEDVLDFPSVNYFIQFPQFTGPTISSCQTGWKSRPLELDDVHNGFKIRYLEGVIKFYIHRYSDFIYDDVYGPLKVKLHDRVNQFDRR